MLKRGHDNILTKLFVFVFFVTFVRCTHRTCPIPDSEPESEIRNLVKIYEISFSQSFHNIFF